MISPAKVVRYELSSVVKDECKRCDLCDSGGLLISSVYFVTVTARGVKAQTFHRALRTNTNIPYKGTTFPLAGMHFLQCLHSVLIKPGLVLQPIQVEKENDYDFLSQFGRRSNSCPCLPLTFQV